MDMINMINMIFDELGLGIGLRWVRKTWDWKLARSREAAKGDKRE